MKTERILDSKKIRELIKAKGLKLYQFAALAKTQSSNLCDALNAAKYGETVSEFMLEKICGALEVNAEEITFQNEIKE